MNVKKINFVIPEAEKYEFSIWLWECLGINIDSLSNEELWDLYFSYLENVINNEC